MLRFAVTSTWYAFSVLFAILKELVPLLLTTSSPLKSPESMVGVLISCRLVVVLYPPFIIKSSLKWNALSLKSEVEPSGDAVGKYVPWATWISIPEQALSIATCKSLYAWEKEDPSPELSGRLASTNNVRPLLVSCIEKVNGFLVLSSLAMLMVAAWTPIVAQLAVKETTKVELIPLSMRLLGAVVILKLGLLTVVSVRFKSKLPLFVIVKVLLSVMPIVTSPKFVPSKIVGIVFPFMISTVFRATKISWEKNS